MRDSRRTSKQHNNRPIPSWMPRPRQHEYDFEEEEQRSLGSFHHHDHDHVQFVDEEDDWSSDIDQGVVTDDEEDDDDHYVYLIRWRRESGVSDWNVMNVVAQVELRDQTAAKVMQHVKAEMIESTAGIQTTEGIFEKVYRHADDAITMGLTDCLRQHLQLTRRGIRDVLGLSMTEYYQLLKKKEIVELKNDHYPGNTVDKTTKSSSLFLNDVSHDSSASHATYQKKRKGCLFQWGMNSLYNDWTAPDLHLCNQIMTDLQIWIERKALY
jgi:hypothetical protein